MNNFIEDAVTITICIIAIIIVVAVFGWLFFIAPSAPRVDCSQMYRTLQAMETKVYDAQ